MFKFNQLTIALMGPVLLAGCSLMGNHEADLSRLRQGNGQGTAGIKNVQQLALAMSEVTGVPLTQSIRDEGSGKNVMLSDQAATISPWLSTDGNVENVNSSMILSITGFAGMFCKAFVANEAAAQAGDRLVHGSVDFNAGAAGLQGTVGSDLLNKYALRFWRRDLTADERQVLQDALSEAVSTMSSGTQNSQSTQRALLVPCTIALSSLEFLKS